MSQIDADKNDIKIRVIDSKKLIEAINAGSYEINLSAVMALGAVVTQSASQWIPCSERLPEEDGQYIVTVKYEHVDGYEDIYSEHGEWVDGHWDACMFGHCGRVEKVLAWQPLPKPWGGER